MELRVVDYMANPGGGVRFTVELLRALREIVDARIELVSHADALERYRGLLREDAGVVLRDIPPVNQWRTRTLLEGVPGAGLLNFLLGTRCFHVDVPAAALEGCDVAWLPWLHRHRMPGAASSRVVGTLHDVITIDFPGILPEFQRRDERETVRGWLASNARLVVSSNVTASRLQELFAARRDRVLVIPLSGMHEAATGRGAIPEGLDSREFLLSPINTSPHKNHEVLLAGVGEWGARRPLVLTGGGTDLWPPRSARAAQLARSARAAGLVPGHSVHGLGYVDDPTYYALLDAAWALVMPTLAEGGGSFPVWEALVHGVPVVCSDIPVMREMMDRVGGRVIWFDPHSQRSLAVALQALEHDYARYKAEAVAQVSRLKVRSWRDVALEYAEALGLLPEHHEPGSGREPGRSKRTGRS